MLYCLFYNVNMLSFFLMFSKEYSNVIDYTIQLWLILISSRTLVV